MFKFCASKKIEDKLELVLCCVFSYIMNAICELMYDRWSNITILATIYGKVVVSSVCFVLICIICAWIIRLSYFENICVFLFHVSPKTDLLEGVLDTPDAVNVRIFLKDKKGSVFGHYAGRDNNSSNPWIGIRDPIVYLDDGSRQDYDKSIVYLIRFADIDHIIVD